MNKTPWQWMLEPLKRYAIFFGRARRREYWWFIIFVIAVELVAVAIDLALGQSGSGLVLGIVALALFMPQLAVTVRRFHDVNRSGWWLLAPVPLLVAAGVFAFTGQTGGYDTFGTLMTAGLIAVAALAFALSLLFLVWQLSPGTIGPNRFGSDPKR